MKLRTPDRKVPRLAEPPLPKVPRARSRRRNARPASHRAKRRRGAALVEFAMIAPLFFMLVIGIVECGRAMMVQQILTNASREGSRRAVLEDATATEVKQVVDQYLSNTSVSGATVTVSPDPLTYVGFGDPVTVTVSVPFDSVSWAGKAWFLGGKTMTATTVMRGERLQ